ncbi:MAG: hypothetical protein P4L84_19625 [Isosphaeraceae bacterium]|nr:hypothetical protein [Isosphaeraceae bacterium]
MATTETTAFNARALAQLLSAEKLYRTYFAPGGLFFIRVGGPRHDQTAIHFGLIGLLISSLTMKGRMKKVEAKIAAMDQQTLRDRLEDHADNFSARFENIISSRIEPTATISLKSPGKHFGRWFVDFEDRKKMLLQFDTLDDMHVAVAELPKVLGAKHENRVEWHDQKNKYVKKRAT